LRGELLIFHFFLCWLFAAISDIAPSHPHNVFFFSLQSTFIRV